MSYEIRILENASLNIMNIRYVKVGSDYSSLDQQFSWRDMMLKDVAKRGNKRAIYMLHSPTGWSEYATGTRYETKQEAAAARNESIACHRRFGRVVNIWDTTTLLLERLRKDAKLRGLDCDKFGLQLSKKKTTYSGYRSVAKDSIDHPTRPHKASSAGKARHQKLFDKAGRDSKYINLSSCGETNFSDPRDAAFVAQVFELDLDRNIPLHLKGIYRTPTIPDWSTM